MAQYIVASGKLVLVDDEDYERLNQYTWYVYGDGYPFRVTPRPEKAIVKLHHMIIQPTEGLEVDHANRNKLDATRKNLVLKTKSQNGQNRGPSSNNKSGYKGVSLRKATGKFKACVMVNNQRKFLGYYSTASEAATAIEVYKSTYEIYS